ARASCASLRDGGTDATGELDMVVFDQHGVEEPTPMVRSPTRPHSIFLEEPQRGSRLPCIEHCNASAGCVDERPCDRRDAREALQKVERRPLSHQQRCRRTSYLRNFFAGMTRLAIVFSF